MICQAPESEGRETAPLLKATRLGRIAVRHFLAPATVLRLATVLKAQPRLTFFDLLLLATSSEDCEPTLPVDFEELDLLAAQVTSEASALLPLPRPALVYLLGIDGKRLLAALKMALVLRQWTRTSEAQVVADQYHCYPFEIARLCESIERLLLAMSALLEQPAEDREEDVPLIERIAALRTMVTTGLDETVVTLTFIPGIGPTLARRLHAIGIVDIEALAQAEAADVAQVRGISPQRAAQLIAQATALLPSRSALRYREHGPRGQVSAPNWPREIDPYRLRRALDLKVQRLDGGIYEVRGGLEPHRVRLTSGRYHCDCQDAAQGNGCKHGLAVRLARGERSLKQLVKQISATAQPDQLDLFDLWFGRSR